MALVHKRAVLLSASILLLAIFSVRATTVEASWSEDTETIPASPAEAPKPEAPAVVTTSMAPTDDVLKIKSKFESLLAMTSTTSESPEAEYCSSPVVTDPSQLQAYLSGLKPGVPTSCWAPVSNLAQTVCSSVCQNSSVLSSLWGAKDEQSSRRLLGGSTAGLDSSLHTQLCADPCLDPFVTDVLSLAKKFTSLECAGIFEDTTTNLVELRNEANIKSNMEWVESTSSSSTGSDRKLLGGDDMDEMIGETSVTKLEIAFGLMCSKNPKDNEYCLTKFHDFKDGKADGQNKRRRRRRRKSELAETEQCDHWQGISSTISSECDGVSGTKDCWHDWCNANCMNAGTLHPACAPTDSEVGAHSRCTCDDSSDKDHTHSTSTGTCDEGVKTTLENIGCCWGDATLWSAQSTETSHLDKITKQAKTCGVVLEKIPCASDLKSSSVELTMTLTNTAANFDEASVRTVLKAALANTPTSEAISWSQVAITDYDSSTALAQDAATGTTAVSATVVLVGDASGSNGQVSKEYATASVQSSLDSVAPGSDLEGATVTDVQATNGYDSGDTGSAVKVQVSWLLALAFCMATYIQQQL